MFEALNAKLESLVADIGALKPELVALLQERRAEVARIEELLLYVDGLNEKSPGTPNRTNGRKKRVAVAESSGCSTKAEIQEIVTEIVATRGKVSHKDLVNGVKEKLRARQRNLSMADKILQDCLKGNLLEESEPGQYVMRQPVEDQIKN